MCHKHRNGIIDHIYQLFQTPVSDSFSSFPYKICHWNYCFVKNNIPAKVSTLILYLNYAAQT